MIIELQIINQPLSGEYKEKIYDLKSKGNSRDWTWVKFTNADYTEWCGQFQGSPINIEMSEKHNTIVLLTSDYLFMLSREDGSLIEYDDYELYRNLTLTPKGDYLISDYFTIELFADSLSSKQIIESPFEMDMIEFREWTNNKLLITCEETRNYEAHHKLLLDSETLELNEILIY